MHTIRPRRVAALLAVLALLLAGLPAGAAPPTDRTAASEPGVGVPLLHDLAVWLAALWPGFGSPAAPQSVWKALGAGLDPGGAPQSESDVPTALPQLGPVADPDG
jgi:hypothetical protein